MSLEPDSAQLVWEGRLLGLTVEQWGENEREIVEHPGAVAIVAVDTKGCVALVRQLREATRKHLLELPAGTTEPGEELSALVPDDQFHRQPVQPGEAATLVWSERDVHHMARA